jgi:hypothetical protein
MSAMRAETMPIARAAARHRRERDGAADVLGADDAEFHLLLGLRHARPSAGYPDPISNDLQARAGAARLLEVCKPDISKRPASGSSRASDRAILRSRTAAARNRRQHPLVACKSLVIYKDHFHSNHMPVFPLLLVIKAAQGYSDDGYYIILAWI